MINEELSEKIKKEMLEYEKETGKNGEERWEIAKRKIEILLRCKAFAMEAEL